MIIPCSNVDFFSSCEENLELILFSFSLGNMRYHPLHHVVQGVVPQGGAQARGCRAAVQAKESGETHLASATFTHHNSQTQQIFG